MIIQIDRAATAKQVIEHPGHAWRCSRCTPDGCGWSGDEQMQRHGAGPGLLYSWHVAEVGREVVDVALAELDWEPAKGVKGGDREDPALAWRERPWCPRCGSPAVEWPAKDDGDVYLRDGADVPSGLQPEEQPTMEQRIAALEARVAALEVKP